MDRFGEGLRGRSILFRKILIHRELRKLKASTRFNEVQDLDLEPDAIERVDFLHAGGARDIHFREKIPNHVQAREKKPILSQKGGQRLANFPVACADLGADALRADMDV